MDIRHYYHVYAAGAWSQPVRDHFDALGHSGFDGDIVIGLVGPEHDRQMAREMIGMHLWARGLADPIKWIEADSGWEQVTLQQIHVDLSSIPGELAVLYAHTKGAMDNSEWNEVWRRSMTRRVVSDWRSCVAMLGDYQTVGCHWLTPERDHDPPKRPITTPMYGGNFWWARASYLRELPPLGTDYRHQAEEWVGLGNPKARDLLPGWPSRKLCRS